MSIELMLLAVNINLVAFSSHLGDLVGQIFTMFILTVAAAEAAIGLALLGVGPDHEALRQEWLNENTGSLLVPWMPDTYVWFIDTATGQWSEESGS
jgi:hypothetical protein